ncbi:MAG: type II secretion system F family protein [Lachnospiraceae bacterium]|nr:type II secretion system F family protein [Lachnospiraceae bacterium]
MKKFKYIAKDVEGKKVGGMLEANDETELYNKLREDNKFLMSSKEVKNRFAPKKIKTKFLAEFCRELGTLLEAGVSLVRALAIIIEEEGIKPQNRVIYAELLQLVRQGVALSDAMAQQGEAFPEMMVNMFRSAEAGGSLDKTALRMANHYEKEHRMNSKIKGAMTYPAILGVLIVAVVIIIFTYVLPQFTSLFSTMESLPWYTEFMLWLSDFIVANWLGIILGVIIIVNVLRLFFKIPAVHRAKDRLMLKLPMIGGLLKVIYTARFARTLSSLYSAGLPIVPSLQIGQKTVGNTYIENQFTEAIDKIRGGENLSAALGRIDGFTKKFTSTIMIGEETGKLDNMLESTADNLEYESEQAISKMMTFLEPIMIVIMAVIVGFIMISVITPIYGSYDSLSNSY